MRLGTLLAVLMLAAAPASAQNPPPDEGSAAAPTPPPPPTPPPAPPPTPPPARPPVIEAGPGPESDMPAGFALGIGIGYVFPTSLETPNVATVRFRLANRVTLEPGVTLSSTSQKSDDGMGDTTTTKTTDVGLSATLRYPVLARHRFELEILGRLAVDRTGTTPPGPNMETTTSTFDAQWGLAVGYWFTRHLQLSLTASNPLITYTSTSQENGVNPTSTTSTSTFGLVFDPTIALMFHVYN